jgi:Lrp/AsnC family leucine-responsive transcriptional regulator
MGLFCCATLGSARNIHAKSGLKSKESRMIELDRIDLRLLAALQAEGRIANTELAERIRLSPSACLRRVQRLEAAGVISGYRAQLSAPALGLGLSAFVRLQLRHHEAEAVSRFGEDVQGWPEVVACHALSGDMDYLLQVQVRDLEHFSRFLLDTLLGSAAVADVNTSFVLRTVKADRGLPIEAA